LWIGESGERPRRGPGGRGRRSSSGVRPRTGPGGRGRRSSSRTLSKRPAGAGESALRRWIALASSWAQTKARVSRSKTSSAKEVKVFNVFVGRQQWKPVESERGR
jgi:hypothetical protein